MKSLIELTKQELTQLGYGPLGVEEVEHCTYSLPDGVPLAMRVWIPKGTDLGLGAEPKCLIEGEDQGGKFPAVLEFLPYRSVKIKEPLKSYPSIIVLQQEGRLDG